MRIRLALPVLLVAALASACGDSPLDPGPGTGDAPEGLAARYEWALDGWFGTQPSGQPTVVLTWFLPDRWSGEVFRVYSRRSGPGGWIQVATVTSCGDETCRYVDANVVSNREYEYYVSAVDERTGRETPSDFDVTVTVPAHAQPPRATAPLVVPLDGTVYLEWQPTQLGDRLWKYLVFMERRSDDSVFFQIGETDGNGFLDMLAQNGESYRYSIAAVDLDGHIGQRSPLSERAFPRPDGLGVLVFAFDDDPGRSGFRFDPVDGGQGSVVNGGSADANWRLESDANEWYLRPLGNAAVVDGGFTTALNCGPGSGPDCQSVELAPESGYQQSRVPLQLEHTYVIRMGSGTTTRYAKVRVQILGFGTQNQPLLIFDWAFQTAPGVRTLKVADGAETQSLVSPALR